MRNIEKISYPSKIISCNYKSKVILVKSCIVIIILYSISNVLKLTVFLCGQMG